MISGGTSSSRSFFAGEALLLAVILVLTCCGWSPPAAHAASFEEKGRREYLHHHHHPHPDSSSLLLRSNGREEIRQHASRMNENWKNEFEAQQTDDGEETLFLVDPAPSTTTVFHAAKAPVDVEAFAADSIIYQQSEEGEEEPQAEQRAMKDVLQSNDDAFVFHKQQKNTKQQQQHDFCQGMYMTMFMDGFHWSLWLKRPSPQCLSYFVQSWRLEDASKFRGAVLFTFLLAVLVEGLSSARGIVVRRSNSINANLQRQHALLTVIYAVQSLLGFVLMLVTMSFSVELFLAVVAGLMVGNLLFIKYNDKSTDEIQRQRSSRTRNNQREGSREEGNPETSPLLANVSAESAANLRRRG